MSGCGVDFRHKWHCSRLVPKRGKLSDCAARSRQPDRRRRSAGPAATFATPLRKRVRHSLGGKTRIGEMAGQRHIPGGGTTRSEEHTSELQSRENLVCRLLLEKKKKNQ